MPNQKAMVAVCDILGFTDLQKQHPAIDLLSGPLGRLHQILHHATCHRDVPPLPVRLHEILGQGRVGVTWYADTFLLYSTEDTDLAVRNVLETAGWMLFETIFSSSPKLRVGVAYGDFLANEADGLFLGQALLEAHFLEEAQQWSGGVLARSAAERIPTRRSSGERFQWWITEYRPPLKADMKLPEASNLCVNWTQGIHRSVNREWSPTSEVPPEETPPQHVLYWKNTWRFHDSVCAESGCLARQDVTLKNRNGF